MIRIICDTPTSNMKMKKIYFRLNLYLEAQNCWGKKIIETENAL